MPTEPQHERRAWVRYSCDVATYCLPSVGGDEVRWESWIRDISRGGMQLVVDRRFESGTILRIEVVGNEDLPSLLVRVIHVRSQPGGRWSLGCRFARELADKELEAFLRAP